MPAPVKSLFWSVVCLAGLALRAFAADEPPAEWIDPTTGHRVVRLSREPGSQSFYFHQNAYTPSGRKIVITSPSGVSSIDLQTRVIEPLIEGRVGTLIVGRKSGDLYYTRREEDGLNVYATNVDTKATRKVAKVPRGSVASVNADETLLLGTYGEEPESAGWQRGGPDAGAAAPATPTASTNPTSSASPTPARGAGRGPEYQANWPDGTPMSFADAKELRLHEQLHRVLAGPPRTLFTISTKTGEMKTVLQERQWINHVQFSPTDPQQIMFCHEGSWHEVDRIWLIRTDGTGLTKVHPRTMNMEIYGHEFFSADGGTIWYDLHTPRGEDLWLAGYEIATGRRTRWHLSNKDWNVHYNVSPDGSLFLGDGSDEEMVSHAPDAKWIYLLRPERIPDVAGISNPSAAGLINPGVFRPERLVSLARHNYQLEPNATFTPDAKWIVFRSNMDGPSHVYAVEVAKAK